MPKEAEMLDYALSLDLRSLAVSLLIIIAVTVSLWLLFKKFQELTGIETKITRERKAIINSVSDLKREID